MIHQKNENGSVRVNSNVYVDIAGSAASNCFGVKGMSARSLGDINVQLILEKLGGGGNSASAGGFVPDSTPAEVMKRLQEAIDEYFAE